MSFRTDFDRKFEKLTKGYHSQTLELVKHNYRQVQDQLGSELETTVTHIATVIDGETNAQTKTERATMVRDHATRMKRLEAEKRRNGKRCREAKMNDRKRPRSVSKPFSASSAASSKSKRKQKNRRHSYQPMPTHRRTARKHHITTITTLPKTLNLTWRRGRYRAKSLEARRGRPATMKNLPPLQSTTIINIF